jgi:hypothetical protein
MSPSASISTVTQPQRTAAGYKAAPQAKEQTAPTDKDDFFWTYTEEPHATRRQAIIKAHPEVHITWDELDERRTAMDTRSSHGFTGSETLRS